MVAWIRSKAIIDIRADTVGRSAIFMQASETVIDGGMGVRYLDEWAHSGFAMMTRMDMTALPVQVSVVDDLAGFDALRDDWLALEQQVPDSSVFMSWDSQRLWWKYYGKGRALRILVARDANRVIGILPLYCERHHKAAGILGIRKLRQIGVGGDTAPDDLDALLLPEFAPLAAVRLAAFVAASVGGWDMLELTDLPATSALVPAWTGQLPGAGLRVQCSAASPIVFGDLPSSFEEYCQGLSSNRRAVMRRKRRKFESQPGARFVTIDTPEGVDQAFDELVRLHRLRWSGRTARPAFSSREFRDYHREWMHTLLSQGRLRLLALEVHGRFIAMLYCMQYKGRWSFFQGGFDPEFSPLSPGEVLMGLAIETAISDGCTVFDMLKGDHEYKRHFFQQDRRNLEIRVFRKGAVSLAYGLRDAWLRHRSKAPVRDHTPT